MKTGLNFYTTTIINSDKFNGKAKFKVENNTLTIKPGMTFEKSNIQKVSYKEGYDGKMAQATIDFTKITDVNTKKYYRLDVYVKVQGAEPYIYATPWIQKGRPFWVEFSLDANQTSASFDGVKAIVNAIDKEHLFQVGDNQITATATAGKLTLTATADYLRFAKVQIVTINDEGDDEKVVNADGLITINEKGKNAFGSYSQIIKDVQLPTAENTRWLHMRQDETPVVGAIYDQFIIKYAAPANNRPLDAVGCEVMSHTTHVFWVKHDLAAAFKKLFTSSLKIGIVKINDTTGAEEAEAAEQSNGQDGRATNSQLDTKSGK